MNRTGTEYIVTDAELKNNSAFNTCNVEFTAGVNLEALGYGE